MITSAGAEGLSLRNVRRVHIMEPFWNSVRTDQVKGRAVRICSHSDLPYNKDPAKNMRVVEIFTYVSVFPEGVKIDATIQNNDGDRTSDQYVLDIANKKRSLSSDFLCHMKSAAVDCKINKGENEKTIRCFYEQQGNIKDFLYDPRLEQDVVTSEQEYKIEPGYFCKPEAAKVVVAEAQEVQEKQEAQEKQEVVAEKQEATDAVPDKPYIVQKIQYIGRYDPSTKKTYLYNPTEDPGFTKRIGYIAIKNGKEGIIKYKTPVVVT
jgi:hypothetical protein